QHFESGRRAGFFNARGGWQSSCGSQTSSVRQKFCFERAAAFSHPLLLKQGGEGRGEEVLYINFPSLRLSPRSFLAGRERQNAACLLRAEHNWSVTAGASPASERFTNPARQSLPTCCGSQSRAPQNRRGLRRFRE